MYQTRQETPPTFGAFSVLIHTKKNGVPPINTHPKNRGTQVTKHVERPPSFGASSVPMHEAQVVAAEGATTKCEVRLLAAGLLISPEVERQPRHSALRKQRE